MKKNLISIVALLSISFLSATIYSEEYHAIMDVNSSATATTGGADDAYFHIYNVEPNAEILFRVERTEFDNGPTAHYKIELANTNIFYYSLYEGDVFSGTFQQGGHITNPMTLRIVDVNRTWFEEPLKPSQNLKLTLTQLNYSTVVFSEDFSNNMNGWETYVDGNASAYAYTRWPGELLAAVSDPGDETWHVHVRKTGIPLNELVDYKVKIRAKKENSNEVRVIKVRIEEDGGDYTGYGEKFIVLGDESNEFSFLFRSPVTTSNAVLCIEMGDFGSQASSSIAIDYISISKN